MEKIICLECGSDKIQAKAWVDVNTQEIIDFSDEFDYYCESCEELVDINIIKI